MSSLTVYTVTTVGQRKSKRICQDLRQLAPAFQEFTVSSIHENQTVKSQGGIVSISKNNTKEAGDLALWLRVLAALTETRVPLPGPTWQLTAIKFQEI